MMTLAADPVLYSFRRCPYAMRARLALGIAGIRCELREVVLRAKPAEMLAASPKGTVPVLVLADGTVIEQSFDIMLWALARHDPEHWLSRHDPALVAACDGPFKHDLDRYKYPHRHGSDALAHRESGLIYLADLDARLAAHGQLCGPMRGLADAAIMPFVRQFAAVEPDWFVAQPLAHLREWLEGHLASDLFQAAMMRVPAWAAGDDPVFYPALP